MNKRFGLAILLPFLALALQWVLWPWLMPFVWFLFFPAIFFSARIGGLAAGLASTVLGTLLVWYFFLPPRLSWHLAHPTNLYSIVLFLLMGFLFSDSQERLRRARQATEQALAEARSAREKITQLYQKTLELDELKSQFFANISHELRTPLTLIMSPLIRRLSAGAESGAVRREDEMMLRSARLLYRHVSDLLDAARLESGQMTVDYSHTNLGGLTRVTAAQFDSLAHEKNIDFRFDALPDLETEIDAEKVQRILLNLLSNAFKFTPDGGCIQLNLQCEGEQALIAVQDNGPGVPQAQREIIFERFRQAEGGARRRHGGTGLGLAIVRDFANLHGGAASVRSAPGGGALFEVRLPLRAPVGREVHPEASPLDPLLGIQAQEELARPAFAPGLTLRAGASAPLVLVVEDHPDMNAFISETLSPYYRVASVFDGDEGLAQAQALKPDLILSDVMMPGMSGDLMVEALRQLPALEDTPIVMLSARADEALRVRLLKLGVQDYLGKPFTVGELLARVDGLITERRRFANKYNESETRFETTFDQAAMGIALASPDGHWLRVNHKLSQITGFTQEELCAMQFQDITHPDDLPVELDQRQQMLCGTIANYSMEKRYLRRDGDAIWVNITVALVRHADGRPDYFISLIEDIQQRKQVEAALIASEQALKAAQQQAGIGSWSWDIVTDQHVWSDEIYHLYGRDPTLPPAPYPEVQQYFTPESWTRLTAAVEQGLKQGDAYVCDAEVVRPDGIHCWVTARGEATRDDDQRIVNLHGTVQDITARKQAEDEIRRLNSDLEQRVLERTAELSAANQELDSFAYAVSHDLRAPLRAMSGFSQALVEDYGDRLDGEAAVYLSEIEGASRKMGELIDGILVLSRCTRGELRHDRIDISALARQQLEQLARDEPARRVEWRVEPGLAVGGDARMIDAVLLNLLGNAWKYTGKTAAPLIRVYAGKISGMTGICVADNGAGFEMEHANQLFQPFRRLHRQDEFPGIGIGLATVQRIIHRHGGEIRAEGHPGVGATFCFSLPDSSPPEEAS